MSIADSIGMYWRFAWGLRKFLQKPIGLEQSKEIIRQGLKERQKNLLELIKRTVYENPKSPYFKLLNLAGCEYGDVEKMILCDGVEFALEKLRIAGVYISLEEFKGKKETIRSGKTFWFRERDFDNPLILSHLETRSSASRSVGTRTIYDFDSLIAYYTIHQVPLIDAYGLWSLPYGFWHSINPGFGPILLLTYSKAGMSPTKWFSPLSEKSFVRSLKHKILTKYIVYSGRLFGAKWPVPEYVSFDDAWKIAKWMADTINDKGGCCLNTYVSNAVRVCHAAKEKGFDFTGAKFIVSGEPISKVKRAEIEATGATTCPIYGFTEGGTVGAGCFRPNQADDVHLYEDNFAVITHPRKVSHAGISVDAFLLTSLLLSTAKVLLNIEIGDYGLIETRNCGCKLGELGFTKHLSNIRAFDKLTGEGISLVGTDLIRIIQEVFPAKFGGASIDYQMFEEEDEHGKTYLSLIISPSVGMIDEGELFETILAELRKGEVSQRVAAETWLHAKTLRVRREHPHTTLQGKLLPLHINLGK